VEYKLKKKTKEEFTLFNNLRIQILADCDLIKKKLHRAGFINKNGASICKETSTPLNSQKIILEFSLKVHRLLTYFNCADNLYSLKQII